MNKTKLEENHSDTLRARFETIKYRHAFILVSIIAEALRLPQNNMES